jgi:nucleotide-binding universal stress UspA family protein
MALAAEVPHRFSDPAKYILHPTDFSPESELAFAHALRIALTNKSRLTLLHVGAKDEMDWDSFPSVRTQLQRWGLLEEGARRADVAKFGVTIEKINVVDSDIVEGIASHLAKHPVDMLVLASTPKRGLAAWLTPSKAEKAAQRIAVPTLFVPAGSRGAVSLEENRVSMKQVLIPVDHQPRVGGALERALRAIAAFGDATSKLTLLHVGPADRFPEVHPPEGPWQFVRATRQGNPVTEIVAAAEESKADLIVMVTQGTHGYLDMLRGTITQQVLRHAPCPVLALPAGM